MEWVNKYAENSTCDHRRVLQAMVSIADDVTGFAVKMLKENGMWDNAVVVVSADNGAPCGGGSNHPLKGGKMNFYEGGVRALAFASGGLIPDFMIGKSTKGFIHIADWYTTFCKLAGVDPTDSGPGKFPVDGIDVWPLITGAVTNTGNKEIVLGFNFSADDVQTNQGAIIVGEHKLIVGPQKRENNSHCDTRWTSLDYPCSQPIEFGDDCDPYCLYNIIDDSEERHNLAKEQPDLLNSLLEQYNKYSKEPRYMQDQGYHSVDDLPNFLGACDYMAQHGGYWQPWEN